MKEYYQLSLKSLLALYEYLHKKKEFLQKREKNQILNIEIFNLSVELRNLSKEILTKTSNIPIKAVIDIIKNDQDNELSELYDVMFYESLMKTRMYDLALLESIKSIINKLSLEMLFSLVCDCKFTDMKQIFLDRYIEIIDESFVINNLIVLEKGEMENEYQRRRKVERS